MRASFSERGKLWMINNLTCITRLRDWHRIVSKSRVATHCFDFWVFIKQKLKRNFIPETVFSWHVPSLNWQIQFIKVNVKWRQQSSFLFAKICIFSVGTEGTGPGVGKYLRLLNIGEQFSLQYQINGNVIVKWTQTWW